MRAAGSGFKLRIAAATTAVLLAATLPAMAANPQDDGNAGLDAMEAGQYDSAISLFTRAINSNALAGDELETAYYQRGLAYLHTHAFKLAKADLQHALTLKPDDAEAKAALALAQMNRAPPDQKAAQATAASTPPAPAPAPSAPAPSRTPSPMSSAAASVSRGIFGALTRTLTDKACAAAGMPDSSSCGGIAQAVASAGQASQPGQPAQTPSGIPPHPHTASEDAGADGMKALDKGRYDQAIRSFTRAINAGDLIPQEAAAAYFNRAKAYYKLGDELQALSDLNHALKLQPTDADTQTAFADMMAAHRRAPRIDPPAQQASCDLTYQSSGSMLKTRKYSMSFDYPHMARLDAFVAAFQTASAEGWAVTAVDSDAGSITASQTPSGGGRPLMIDMQISPLAPNGSHISITATAPPLMITIDLKTEMCKFLADMAS